MKKNKKENKGNKQTVVYLQKTLRFNYYYYHTRRGKHYKHIKNTENRKHHKYEKHSVKHKIRLIGKLCIPFIIGNKRLVLYKKAKENDSSEA